MSTKAPLPNSANRRTPPQAASAPAGNATPKIIALMVTVVAGVIAYLLKAEPYYTAGASLIGIVVAFGAIFILSRSDEDAPSAPSGDATGDLARTIDANRAEYNARIAELKKSLEAYKADNAASQENEAIRQEIGHLRSELAGLRSAVVTR